MVDADRNLSELDAGLRARSRKPEVQGKGIDDLLDYVLKLAAPLLLPRRAASHFAEIAENSVDWFHAVEQPGCFKRL